MMEYKPRPGNPLGIGKEEAQELGEELDRLEGKLGHDPLNREVLESAKAKRSPFHKYLEWDDGKAADGYRLHQVGSVRQCVMRCVVNERGEHLTVPRSSHVTVQTWMPEGERSEPEVMRVSFADALTDEQKGHALAESTFRRVQHYRDQLAVFPVFDDLVAELDRLGHVFAGGVDVNATTEA